MHFEPIRGNMAGQRNTYAERYVIRMLWDDDAAFDMNASYWMKDLANELKWIRFYS